jgi:hypothetical protein
MVMATQISLKEAEKKVFKTKLNDGLWDIFIGCFFLIFAVAPLLSTQLGDFWSSLIFLPFWGFIFLIIWWLRKYLVAPRIGKVQFGHNRQKKLRQFTLVMLMINCAAFVTGIVSAAMFGVLSRLTPLFIFGLIILTLFSTAAYFLDFRRLYFYGLLGGLSPLIGEWLYVSQGVSHHGFPITFGLTSTIMILIGLTIFIRLLRDHPEPVQEPHSKET